MKQMNKEVNFFAFFLGKLGSSVLGNMLTHTGVMRVGEKLIRAG